VADRRRPGAFVLASVAIVTFVAALLWPSVLVGMALAGPLLVTFGSLMVTSRSPHGDKVPPSTGLG